MCGPILAVAVALRGCRAGGRGLGKEPPAAFLFASAIGGCRPGERPAGPAYGRAWNSAGAIHAGYSLLHPLQIDGPDSRPTVSAEYARVQRSLSPIAPRAAFRRALCVVLVHVAGAGPVW